MIREAQREQAGSSREVHSTVKEASKPEATQDIEDPVRIRRPRSPIVLITSERTNNRAVEPPGRRVYQRKIWGPASRTSRRILERERGELAKDEAAQYSLIGALWQQEYLWLLRPLFEHANRLGSSGRELLTIHAVIAASTQRAGPKVEQRMHRDDLPPLPSKWKDLLHHPLGALFRQACQKEINTLLLKNTWQEVARTSNQPRALPLK